MVVRLFDMQRLSCGQPASDHVSEQGVIMIDFLPEERADDLRQAGRKSTGNQYRCDAFAGLADSYKFSASSSLHQSDSSVRNCSVSFPPSGHGTGAAGRGSTDAQGVPERIEGVLLPDADGGGRYANPNRHI